LAEILPARYFWTDLRRGDSDRRHTRRRHR